MSDTIATVISGCINGDRRSRKQLYDLICQEMFAICLIACRNTEDIEEVLIIGFINLFNSLKQYTGEVAFDSWCKEIFIGAVNEYYGIRKPDK